MLWPSVVRAQLRGVKAVVVCSVVMSRVITSSGCNAMVCCVRSEDVDFDAFARDLQSFFTELESLNSSLVLTADASAGRLAPFFWIAWQKGCPVHRTQTRNSTFLHVPTHRTEYGGGAVVANSSHDVLIQGPAYSTPVPFAHGRCEAHTSEALY